MWPLAAFGGRSATVAIPFSAASLLLAVAVTFWRGPKPRPGPLEYALAAILLFTVMQVLPLPGGLVATLSPHAWNLRRALLVDPSTARSWEPLSIDQRATVWAALVTLGASALFVAARRVFSRGGVRQTVRGISGMGLAVSAIAIAQAATAGRLIYWRFRTEYEGPLPFGPFVNRNHFATWAIMAAPVCFGYVVARANKPAPPPGSLVNPRTRLARLADGRTLWLTAAGACMISALLLSLSRSGIVSLSVAGIVGLLTLRPRAAVGRGVWLLAGVLVAVGLGIAFADLPAVADRFTRSGSGIENRVAIWRETIPVVRDFWLVGTGAGTYRTAMLFYQKSVRIVQFNQAHNHYLQVASEGGLVLLTMVAGALVGLTRAVRARLSADIHGTYWLRAGAVTGLIAVALQSVWETGLVMPANAALAAVLAAIAVHERLPAEKSILSTDAAETGRGH
ncbi:MAG TPA: O-antigen ligase family protein [Verrucomicrobiae bacterium]|nr:O-antigen ligase family protein [Verrucomicrobiae bacterium]